MRFSPQSRFGPLARNEGWLATFEDLGRNFVETRKLIQLAFFLRQIPQVLEASDTPTDRQDRQHGCQDHIYRDHDGRDRILVEVVDTLDFPTE